MAKKVVVEQKAEVAWGQRVGAEILGTAGLTFASAGIEILAKLYPGDYGVGLQSVGPPLIIVALIYGLGKISGAHFNPAVTTAFAARGDLPWKSVPIYFFSEITGSLFASFALYFLFGAASSGGVNHPLDVVGRAFAMEIILTFTLCFVVLSTATQHRVLGPNAALPVGMTIAGCGLLGKKLVAPR